MLKRMVATAIVAALGVWLLSNCNSSSTTNITRAANGTLVTFVSDVPFCGITNFNATITGLGFAPQGSTGVYHIFGTPSLRQPFYKVPFAKLRDFSAILDVGTIPAGTYDRAIITLGIPSITTFDPAASPQSGILSAALSSTGPQVNINPPLVITAGSVTGLHIDFNIQKSLKLDAQGQVLPNITPVISVTPITASTTNGFGELDDLKGFVTSVITSSTGAGFVGGFGLETLSGSGPLVTANLTASTQVCGLATPGDPDGHCVPLVPATGTPPVMLSQLLTGSYISLDGYVDMHGNLVATTIDVEDREVPEQNHLGLVGAVVPGSITRDSSGNVTQFNLLLNEVEPDDASLVPDFSTVIVNLSPTTLYQFSGHSANFASLSLDATSIKDGQELVVHGVVTPGTGTGVSVSSATIAADKVYLRLQAHQGNFSSLVASQGDDKTGAFWFDTCSDLFQGSPILVLTNGPAGVLTGGPSDNVINFSQTAFAGLTGLSALTPQPSLLVKGLLFYDRPGGLVNGVTVPPGTLVMLAKQVHQLD